MEATETLIPKLQTKLQKSLSKALGAAQVRHAIRCAQAASGRIVRFSFEFGLGGEPEDCGLSNARRSEKILALEQTVLTAIRSRCDYADLVRLDKKIKKQLPSFGWRLIIRLEPPEPIPSVLYFTDADRAFLHGIHIAPT